MKLGGVIMSYDFGATFIMFVGSLVLAMRVVVRERQFDEITKFGVMLLFGGFSVKGALDILHQTTAVLTWGLASGIGVGMFAAGTVFLALVLYCEPVRKRVTKSKRSSRCEVDKEE
jgi:hypothetical protein